jgi:hypothetical protein
MALQSNRDQVLDALEGVVLEREKFRETGRRLEGWTRRLFQHFHGNVCDNDLPHQVTYGLVIRQPLERLVDLYNFTGG